MHKRLPRLAALLLVALLLAPPAARADVTLHLNGIDLQYAGDFPMQHPGVTLSGDACVHYSTTAELAAGLRRDAPDAFVLASDCVDHRALMQAGACLDLSGSEVLREAISRLHPAFAAQCVLDGRIYAIPHTFQLHALTFSPAVARQAGMEAVDVPTTFPELLDFIARWLAFKQENPRCDTALLGRPYWGGDYKAASYPLFLVDCLLENFMMQQAYAGEPLHFDEAELVPLLERCYRLGQALHQHDRGMQCRNTLISTGLPTAFPAEAEVLFLRLRENQPCLVPTSVSLYAVHADTQQPDLCIALMEQLCQHNWPLYNTLLYRDTAPLPDPNYPSEVARLQAMVESTQSQLNRGASDRAELEARLERQQAILRDHLENEDRQYLVTAAELTAFRAHADSLFVPRPDVFQQSRGAAEAFRDLKLQFATGQISAQALVQALNAQLAPEQEKASH